MSDSYRDNTNDVTPTCAVIQVGNYYEVIQTYEQIENEITRILNKSVKKLRKLIKESRSKDIMFIKLIKALYRARKQNNILIVNQNLPKTFVFDRIKPYIRNTLPEKIRIDE